MPDNYFGVILCEECDPAMNNKTTKLSPFLPREYQEELRERVAQIFLPELWRATVDASESANKRIMATAFDLAELFIEEAGNRRAAQL